MQSFPSEFPVVAIQQLVKFVTKSDSDLPKAALAAYNVIGYAGFQAFGQPVLQLVNGTPPGVVTTTKELTDEEVTEAVQAFNDVINTGPLTSSGLKTSLKDKIPEWLIKYLLTILMNYLTKINNG